MKKRTLRIRPTAVLLLWIAAFSHNPRTLPAADHGHAHSSERSVAVTVWTKIAEVFAEYPYVVAGKPASFVTHVTRLADFSPLREGAVTFVMSGSGRTLEHIENAPKRPGIYIPDLTFPSAGKWSVSVQIPHEQGRHDIPLGDVEVYPNQDAADHAPDQPEVEGISFLKEQQWVMPFMVQTVEARVADSVPQVILPDTTLASTGERSFVFVQLGGETFELRRVTSEMRSDGTVIISQGLTPGEHVVTKGVGSVALAMGSTAGDRIDPRTVAVTAEQIKRFRIATKAVEAGGVDAWITVPGEITINDDRMVHVVPRAAGTARSVHAKLGDVVQAGQILAVFESRSLADAKAAYMAAGQRLELARSSYQREEGLYEKKVSSQQDYLAAKQAYEEAQIQWSTTRQKLLTYGLKIADLETLSSEPEEDFTIYRMVAPFDGTVISKHLALGEVVDETSEVFVIADLRNVWVDLVINETNIGSVQAGQLAEVSLIDGQSKVQASIHYVDPIVDPKTRTAVVRATLDNTSGRYKPGRFVRGRIRVGGADSALKIPAAAVQLIDDHTIVFVKCPEGFEVRPVTLGMSNNNEVEIVDGLTSGDEVVTENAFHLKAELEKQAAGAGGGHGHVH